MIDKQFLEILICPENQTPLGVADEALLAGLNRAIAAGKIQNRGGQTVREPLQDGLVRKDRAVIYPIIDGIPVLLADEGIPLDRRVVDGE